MKLRFLVVLSVLLSVLTFQAPAANAATSYDHVINVTGNLLVSDHHDGTADISKKWRAILATCNPAASSSLESAIANGGYWLVIRENNGNDAYIRWTADSNAKTLFYMLNGTEPAWGTSAGISSVARISWYDSSGNSSCIEYYPNFSSIRQETLFTASNSSALGLFLSTYPNVAPDEGSYEGQAIPTAPLPASYVAMGDSFSSGEGNPAFEVGTDIGSGDDKNQCHRSSQAYPYMLKDELSLGQLDFVACSSATTQHVLFGGRAEGSWGEPPQIDAITSNTKVVTITIGGNDVGFNSYIIGCTTICGPGTPIYSAMLDGINAPAFKSTLESVYEAIITKLTLSTAQVYVIDYPYMSPENILRCGEIDFSGARTIQVALNSVIKDAVREVGNSKLHYVDTNQPDSPFSGKYLCNGGPSDFGVLTFHPNTAGHRDYANVIESYISSQ